VGIVATITFMLGKRRGDFVDKVSLPYIQKEAGLLATFLRHANVTGMPLSAPRFWRSKTESRTQVA
jgi:hypothetical protein